MSAILDMPATRRICRSITLPAWALLYLFVATSAHAQTVCIPPAAWMNPTMAWYNARACEQAAREQAAAQLQAQKDAAEAAKRQAAQREQQRVARAEAEAAQRKAEESPNNICRRLARMLLSDFGDLPTMKERDIEAVDIEHLVTVRYDADHSVMVCHGRFVLNRGPALNGTMTFKLNIAGDMIYSWVTD